jgi:excinuclease ABC subunit B
MYADEVTASMQRALDETNRRRLLQEEYNTRHGIVPETIVKSIEEVMAQTAVVAERGGSAVELPEQLPEALGGETDREGMIARLEKEMLEAAAKLEFELAASLRDRVLELRAETASGIVAMRPAASVRHRKSAHSRRRSRR